MLNADSLQKNNNTKIKQKGELIFILVALTVVLKSLKLLEKKNDLLKV